MTSMTVVRRLPVALLIALLVSVAIGTGVASAEEPEPASMYVAEPMLGDKGSYQITLTGDWNGRMSIAENEPDWETPWEYMRFAWEEVDMLDAEGAPVTAAMLRMTAWEWDYDIFTDEWALEDTHFRRAWVGDEPLLAGSNSAWESGMPGAGVGDVRAPALQEGMGIEIDYDHYGNFFDDCVAGRMFDGVRLTVGDAAPLPDSCYNLGHATYYGMPWSVMIERERYDVGGVETVNGVEAMRVDLAEQTHWYAPGIPVPVRVSVMLDDGRGAELDLLGFQRGEAPLPEPARGAPMALPEKAAIQPYGPVSDASSFSAAAAWEEAKTDAAVQRFLDRGAYVAQSSRDLTTNFEHDRITWKFLLNDGAQGLSVEVSESYPASVRDMPFLREQLAERRVDAEISRYFDADQYPPASALPAEAPTVAAVVERWKAYGGEGEADTWGHHVLCGIDCSQVFYEVYAGVAQIEAYNVQTLADNTGGLRVDYDALSMVDDRVVGTSRFAIDGGGVVVPGMDDPSEEAQSLEVPGEQAWFSPAVVAGAGIFGVLMGALYAVWPALKAGPLALFSRLKKPELLEHPTRQAIHDMVTARPGIHFKEMQRTLELAPGTLRHHVRHLVNQEILKERPLGGYTCYFLHDVGRQEVATLGVVKSDGARAVLEQIRAQPGITGKQVAAATGLSSGTVAYHVKRLQETGAVNAERDGRMVRLAAA